MPGMSHPTVVLPSLPLCPSRVGAPGRPRWVPSCLGGLVLAGLGSFAVLPLPSQWCIFADKG